MSEIVIPGKYDFFSEPVEIEFINDLIFFQRYQMSVSQCSLSRCRRQFRYRQNQIQDGFHLEMIGNFLTEEFIAERRATCFQSAAFGRKPASGSAEWSYLIFPVFLDDPEPGALDRLHTDVRLAAIAATAAKDSAEAGKTLTHLHFKLPVFIRSLNAQFG